MASKHPLADGKTIMAEFISKRANNKSHARTHAGHHSHAHNHNSASLSLSLFLLRSRSPTAVVERKKNNNTSWPNFCSRCFCLRRCQRRKQGGVRHRRTLIKHSQRPHTHKHTHTNAQDGWRRRQRARVRARGADAGASETARCGRVKCDECAIILLYVCRERAALLFFQLPFLT